MNWDSFFFGCVGIIADVASIVSLVILWQIGKHFGITKTEAPAQEGE